MPPSIGSKKRYIRAATGDDVAKAFNRKVEDAVALPGKVMSGVSQAVKEGSQSLRDSLPSQIEDQDYKLQYPKSKKSKAQLAYLKSYESRVRLQKAQANREKAEKAIDADEQIVRGIDEQVRDDSTAAGEFLSTAASLKPKAKPSGNTTTIKVKRQGSSATRIAEGNATTVKRNPPTVVDKKPTVVDKKPRKAKKVFKLATKYKQLPGEDLAAYRKRIAKMRVDKNAVGKNTDSFEFTTAEKSMIKRNPAPKRLQQLRVLDARQQAAAFRKKYGKPDTKMYPKLDKKTKDYLDAVDRKRKANADKWNIPPENEFNGPDALEEWARPGEYDYTDARKGQRRNRPKVKKASSPDPLTEWATKSKLSDQWKTIVQKKKK